MAEQISRRELIKAGAGTTAAAGLAFAATRAARADDANGSGAVSVNIHGELTAVSDPGFQVEINIDVAGRRGDLSGAGWDFSPDESPPSSGACYFWQAGSFKEGWVVLQGKVLFSNTADLLEAVVKTKANPSTGQIVWDFAGFKTKGKGTVTVLQR
jgi:hypothetical protein